MTWNKESSSKGSKIAEPHSDWRLNYSHWRDTLDNKNFRSTVGHCDIWEYYLAEGKSFRVIIWCPKTKTGTLKRIVGSKDYKKDINPIGIPTHCLFAWKDELLGNCCCDLNFHVDYDKFKNHMNYYLKIEKELERGAYNGLFDR